MRLFYLLILIKIVIQMERLIHYSYFPSSMLYIKECLVTTGNLHESTVKVNSYSSVEERGGIASEYTAFHFL